MAINIKNKNWDFMSNAIEGDTNYSFQSAYQAADNARVFLANLKAKISSENGQEAAENLVPTWNLQHALNRLADYFQGNGGSLTKEDARIFYSYAYLSAEKLENIIAAELPDLTI